MATVRDEDPPSPEPYGTSDDSSMSSGSSTSSASSSAPAQPPTTQDRLRQGHPLDSHRLADRRGGETRVCGHDAEGLAVVGADTELVHHGLSDRAGFVVVAALAVQADEGAGHPPRDRSD